MDEESLHRGEKPLSPIFRLEEILAEFKALLSSEKKENREDVRFRAVFSQISNEFFHAIKILRDNAHLLEEEEKKELLKTLSHLVESVVKNPCIPWNQEVPLFEKIGLEWDDIHSYYEIAFLLFEGKKYQESAEIFQLLTIISPFHYDFWMGLGMARSKEGKGHHALAAYRFAHMIEPESPEILVCLIEEEIRERDLDSAKHSIFEMERLMIFLPYNYLWQEALSDLKKMWVAAGGSS